MLVAGIFSAATVLALSVLTSDPPPRNSDDHIATVATGTGEVGPSGFGSMEDVSLCRLSVEDVENAYRGPLVARVLSDYAAMCRTPQGVERVPAPNG